MVLQPGVPTHIACYQENSWMSLKYLSLWTLHEFSVCHKIKNDGNILKTFC